MQFIRSLVISGIVIALFQSAQCLPIVSTMTQSTLPPDCPSVGKVVPVTADSFVAWGGRFLELAEVGLTYTPAQMLSLGIAYRNTDGSGHSHETAYYANGWEAWGSLSLLKERGNRPEITLDAQTISGNVSRCEKTARWNNFMRRPPLTPLGSISARPVTAARMSGNSMPEPTTWLFSRYGRPRYWGWAPATATTYRPNLSQVALAGFQDNFLGGGYHTYVLQAGLQASTTEKPHLEFSGTFFPCGIPLAGTTFSPLAMAGAYFSDSIAASLNKKPFGYLSIKGTIPF